MEFDYMGERSEFTGTKIRRSSDNDPLPTPESWKPPVRNKTQYSLYLSQVPYSLTKEQLAEHFEKVGCSVKSCRIVTTGKNMSGKSKGVAFIDMDDAVSYKKALTLHRTKLLDRKLNVRPTLTPDELEEKVNAREQKLSELFSKEGIEGDSSERGKAKRGTCFAFQKGDCERGDRCKFSHADSTNENSDKQVKRKAAGAGICFAFQKGDCERGDRCKFSHADSTNENSDKQVKSKAAGAGICFAFQKGDCERGDRCKFSHADSTNENSDKQVKSKAAGAGICFAFQKGSCTRADKCKFSHDKSNEVNRAEKEKVCFDFKKGDCTRGDRCKFSHAISKSDTIDTGVKKKRKEPGVCFAFQKGNCNRADKCKFSHSKPNEPSESNKSVQGNPKLLVKEKVCFSFQKGECERGENCRFLHKKSSQTAANKEHGKEASLVRVQKEDPSSDVQNDGVKRKSPKEVRNSSSEQAEQSTSSKKRKLNKAERAKRAAIIRSRNIKRKSK